MHTAGAESGLSPRTGEAEVEGGGALDRLLTKTPYTAHSLQMALDALPVGVSWASLETRSILFMNQKLSEISGYTLEDFADAGDWAEKVYPFAEDRARAAEKWNAHFAAPAAHQRATIDPIELRMLCKDGSLKTMIHSGVILPETGWALATFVDITERKRDEERYQAAEREARENESIYRLLLDHSPGMIILAPFDTSKRYVSPSVEQLTGFTPSEYLGMKHPGMLHPDDHQGARYVVQQIRAGNLSQVFRYRTLQKKGGYRWVEAVITGYLNPVSQQPAGYIATVRDIAEQKIREETLAYENRQLTQVASLDELTGIANRRTFNQMLEVEGRRQARAGGDLSLLLLDVDFFKQFNDRYGHLPGDACLQKIAATLHQSLRRAGDLAARFGGEEFVALLPMTDTAGAVATARTIIRAISALGIPHADSPHRVVTISIGVATWPASKPLSQIDLLEQADQALYQAKRGGRNQYQVLEMELGGE
jgi:diguanylate cyclase (GGDEF)-like protein/PAS domain S-box-containing protein